MRLGIAAALSLSFGAVVVLGTAGVAAVALGTARHNTLSLLADKAELAIDALEQELRQHLDVVRDGTLYVARLVETGDIDPADRSALVTTLIAAMAAAPQVVGMAFVDLEGHILRVQRAGASADVIAGDAGGASQRRVLLERMRAGSAAFWGPLVRPPGVDLTLVNFRAPLRRGGRLVGGLISAVSVAELSRYLELRSRLSPVPDRFILYGGGHVLAHASMSHGHFMRTALFPVPALDQVGDAVLARIWDDAARRPLPLPLGGRTRGHVIVGEGGAHVFLYRMVEGYGPEPLFVGAYLETGGELTAEIDRLLRAVAVAAVILVLSVLAALAIGRRLGRPIRMLAGAARRVGDLSFTEAPPLATSRIREIDEAGRAFEAMLEGLRWFENYVPRSLVRHILAAGRGAEIVSESREITVLFTDIAGFTGLAERMDAAGTAALLNEHFSLIAHEIEREDGIIDKYIGDSVMAFWGPPVGGSDHALRACRTARGIATALAAGNASRRDAGLPPIRVRIGLHTGPAIVGNIGAPGRVNYTVIGDTVNIAQRLQELGKTWAADADAVVLASEATVAAASLEGDVAGLGRHAVRGRDGGIAVFDLSP